MRELCRCLECHAERLLRLAAAAGVGARAEDRRLRVLVRASFEESRQRYGSPRVHEDLIEQDERVSRKRVVRLMQEDGLEARVRKRFKATTMSDHDQPVAANMLDRQFDGATRRISAGSATRPSSSSAAAASCTWRRSSICSRGSSWAGRSAPSTTGT